MVNGSPPGPAPAAQARASSSRFTRSNWLTYLHQKLRMRVPRVDSGYTLQPRTAAIPPVRRLSASPIQSPPGRADAASVVILSSTLARVRIKSKGRSISWERHGL